MNTIDIANGLVFKALGVDKNTFDERLISQKKIFLAQSLGLNLGYSYNWYIKGPYSPDLTTYLYDNLDILKENEFQDYTLSPNSYEIVEKVNSLSNSKPDALNDASWFELLASVLYICINWNCAESITDKLIEYKPQFNRTQVAEAVRILRENGFSIGAKVG